MAPGAGVTPALLTALAGAGQPGAGFAALDAALGQAIGHKLFTIMVLDEARGVNWRGYSSQPLAYPVSGQKPLPRHSELYRKVVAQGVPRLCDGRAEMTAAFADHALIFSLGCESALNVPVRWNGATLGALNLLHVAGHYSDVDLAVLEGFAALAVAPLMALTPP